MSQPLAKVTGDLDAPRGPDAVHPLRVPRAWLDEGATIEVELPAKASCAACRGGGCDACQRSGAVRLGSAEERAAPLRVVLPRRSDASDFVIRIPGAGGASADPELGRGHLLLEVHPFEGATPRAPSPSAEAATDGALAQGPGAALAVSPGVSLVKPLVDREAARRRVAVQSTVMAVALVALFLGLLRFSGWM